MTDTVRVPREPTEAMLEASNRAAMAFAGGDLSDADMTRLVWSAMLAASPQGEGSSAEADQDALIDRTCRECRALHRIFTEGMKP
jgi:hypothetical protein